MGLSRRDTAKVNAALLLIHDGGHDANEVSTLAARYSANGTPVRQSWQNAFNRFVERVPSFHAPLQRVGQFMDAVDDRKVAAYGLALSRYIETGDASTLEPIMPSLAQDLTDMSALTGDPVFAEGLEDYIPPEATPEQAQTATASVRSDVSSTFDRPGRGPTGYTPSLDTSRAAAPVEGQPHP